MYRRPYHAVFTCKRFCRRILPSRTGSAVIRWAWSIGVFTSRPLKLVDQGRRSGKVPHSPGDRQGVAELDRSYENECGERVTRRKIAMFREGRAMTLIEVEPATDSVAENPVRDCYTLLDVARIRGARTLPKESTSVLASHALPT